MNNYFSSLIFILTILILCACTDDFPEPERIRPFFGLIASDIPYAENLDNFHYRNPQISRLCLNGEIKYVDFNYSWYNPADSSLLNISISIAESIEDAALILIHKSKMKSYGWCFYSNKDDLEVDDVTLVGDKSMGAGQLFMRDNIIVSIRPSYFSCHKLYRQTPDYSITDIAEAIDRKIKRTKTYPSANELKPVIKDIIFEKYPIPYAEEIQVDLLVEPAGSVLQTKFDFPPSRFYASTLTSGYLWLDTLDRIKNNEHKLSVYAVSEYGFCADTTFVIQIEPWQ